MNQINIATNGHELVTKRTRKHVFINGMNLVFPWTELVGLIQLFVCVYWHRQPMGGRLSFPLETMLRIHFLKVWFVMCDPAMEEDLHDISLYCEFAGIDSVTTLLALSNL
jgi:IS5 family transposase